MSMKHVIEGLMQATNSRSYRDLSKKTDLPQNSILHSAPAKGAGISMETIERVQARSGVSFDQLFAWYRLPAHIQLSRPALMELAS